ncbi:MAG: energy transducer TonB [Gammaproteobacteria bacterium]|nr:energy transducer TonB [Gammaproteobacteria bacterium]
MNASIEEPVIPPRLQRPLAAVWISLGLHAALLALVQVAPPASLSLGDPVIEARLVSPPAVLPAEETAPAVPAVDMQTDPPPEAVPVPAPSEAADALPVAEPLAPPPVEQPAATSTAEAPAASAANPAIAPPAAPAPAASFPPPAAAAPAASTPAATITTAVDLTYYGARDVDVPPRALREIVPDYPAVADRERLSGTVRLQLKLEADGRIGAIEVVSASPPGVFDESAIKAFGDARFAPAQKNGRPVRALVLIEVVYDWEGHR